MPPQDDVKRLTKTGYRKETGEYIPRVFNALTQERFVRARREKHLRRINGEPQDAQIQVAIRLATLEWGALMAERSGSLAAPATRAGASCGLPGQHTRGQQKLNRVQFSVLNVSSASSSERRLTAADDTLAALFAAAVVAPTHRPDRVRLVR